MTHYTRVIQGIKAYADAELLSKMSGSIKGWILGAALEIIGSSAEGVFRMAQGLPFVTGLGLIDGENIDVDRLYGALRKAAQCGPATVDIRFIGPITFSAADVDALYRHIKEA